MSDAELSDLSRQVSDACGFLERYAGDLRALASLETLEDITLEFPIERRIGRNDVVAQFDYFPPELVKAAGAFGIGIEVSIYSCSGKDDEDNDDGSA